MALVRPLGQKPFARLMPLHRWSDHPQRSRRQEGQTSDPVGDIIAVPQGVVCRIVRVTALGSRRGPSTEARLLYEETATLAGTGERDLAWEPLLE